MAICFKCKKKIGLLSKKYYIYPGSRKGSLDISDEKYNCADCLYSKTEQPKLKEIKKEIEILLSRNQYEDALKLFDTIFDKKDEKDWYKKGEILLNLNKTKDALKCFDEALFIDTHYANAWYKKGWVLMVLKKFTQAVQAFDNVISLEGMGNEKIDIVQEGPIVSYKIKTLSIASLLMAAISLSQAKKSKEAEKYFQELHDNLEDISPFNGMDDKMFTDHCLQYWNQLLHQFEPRIIVDKHKKGKKH